MNGRYLLDTNIVIALFGQDLAITRRLGEAEEVFISSIVLGELYYGARRSQRAESNVAKIDNFAAGMPVVAVEAQTAREYGRIKDHLRAKGKLIPENDIWLAGAAQAYSLTLVSRDDHFKEVQGLSLEKW